MTETTNNWDMIETNDLSKNALGGSELQLRRIYDGFIPRELLEKFQIIPSRARDLNPEKYRIYIIQDLPNDPEVSNALKDGGWRNFHFIVFVSHWQAQRFIDMYGIDWSRTVVMQNAITPIMPETKIDKPTDQINIIYHTTPHRGLNILCTVFDELVKKHPNIHLDVYSSFKLYGWEERDKQFQPLFDYCNSHPKITYHGSKPNEEVREALVKSHIFAYPSIWPETSCMCLMEAMSAGNICVHPDFAALYETAANWTSMYRWHENIEEHAKRFFAVMDATINEIHNDSENLRIRLESQKRYTDIFYNWNVRRTQWKMFLENVLASNLPVGFEEEQFIYRA